MPRQASPWNLQRKLWENIQTPQEGWQKKFLKLPINPEKSFENTGHSNNFKTHQIFGETMRSPNHQRLPPTHRVAAALLRGRTATPQDWRNWWQTLPKASWS